MDFLINEIDNKLVITHSQPEEMQKQKHFVNVKFDENKSEFETEHESSSALNSVFETFYQKLMLVNFNEKQRDTVLDFTESLIRSYSEILCSSQNDIEVQQKLNAISEIMCEKIRQRNTQYKRLKAAKDNPSYVPPDRKLISMKWKTELDPSKEIPNHSLSPNMFHYVSMLNQLTSMFQRPEFKQKYLDYNLSQKHKCVDGIYKDYCCAKNGKECELFEDPKTLQIELYIDDFENSAPLKTKTTLHSLTAILFRIRNLPATYNSRLENIHLIALCKVQDVKQGDSFDELIKPVVNEFKKLQTVGLDLGDVNIKGTLINIGADNLGANGIFGLVKCFNTDGFCRICTCTKRCSETQTTETSETMRNIDTYQDHLQRVREGSDTKQSKGIVQYCLFNDLKYFHTFDNYCIDIMHDVCEGIIHVFLKFFFDTAMKKKVFSSTDITRMIRDFNYGFLSQRNKPSKIILTKPKLNQNAIQSLNLILNLPFIFYEKKDKMQDVWHLLTLLLQIIQIIFSTEISENNLERLSNLIPKFLDGSVKNSISLTSKMHNMIHYVTVIRKMGPLIHMWTMRAESKHKIFTNISRSTNCFKNITETLATRYQQMAYLQVDMFSNKMVPSKRKGLMLILDESILEISEILDAENIFLLVCSRYKLNTFNTDLNSIEISKIENEYKLVSLAERFPMPYEKKILKCKSFIIADTLNVYQC